VFVTATDTSAGKTMLAAGLTGYLKARGLNFDSRAGIT
jgi:dethiobiotin synthetase